MGVLAQRSERFEAWVAPGRPRAQIWRIALGVGLAAAVWVAAIGVVLLASDRLGLAPGRGGLVLFLYSFAALILGLGLAVRRLHGLPIGALIGPEGRLRWPGVIVGVAVVAAIATATLTPLALVEPPERQLELAVWLAWLPLALPALCLQAAAEEMAFRGYLQGQLAARHRSRLVWWVLPAVLFGALHWNPAELGENAGLMVLAATFMGLVLGDVTARTGDLSVAIGLHAANNALAVLIMATPSTLSDLSLWLSPLDPRDPAAVRAALIGNLAVIAVAYGVYLWWMARRLQSRPPGSI